MRPSTPASSDAGDLGSAHILEALAAIQSQVQGLGQEVSQLRAQQQSSAGDAEAAAAAAASRALAELAASQPAQPATPAQTPRAAPQVQPAVQQQSTPLQGLAQFPPGLRIPNRPAPPQEQAVLQPLPHQWGATRSAIEAIARDPAAPAQDRAAAQQYLLEEAHRSQEVDMLGQDANEGRWGRLLAVVDPD